MRQSLNHSHKTAETTSPSYAGKFRFGFPRSRQHQSVTALTRTISCLVTLTGGVLSLGLLTGCGEKSPTSEINSPLADSQVTPATEKRPTSIVAPSKLGSATSPAEATNPLPAADAEPEVVCLRFMELLQSGNRVVAENLLTRTALTATSKAGLQLEPMGGSQARYELGATRFATIKNELAYVDCEIVENISGEATRSPLTWVMRKQNIGWRIAGLLMQLEPDQPEYFLSFENIHDVEKIKGLASAEFEGVLETRQANASNAPDADASSLK